MVLRILLADQHTHTNRARVKQFESAAGDGSRSALAIQPQYNRNSSINDTQILNTEQQHTVPKTPIKGSIKGHTLAKRKRETNSSTHTHTHIYT